MLRCVLDSNQCKRFCRPPPSHSDNSPYCSFSRTRTYTLTFVVLCDNPFHYETICTGLQTRTVIKGFGDLHATIAPNRMCVGIKRIELLTFRVSGECSNQLSYIPILHFLVLLCCVVLTISVGNAGFEPTASSSQS